MHCGSAVLLSLADACALPKKVLKQLKTPTNFPTKSLLELFCFDQSIFPGEMALREEKRAFWRPIVNISVATVDKRSNDEGIARYTSTARVLQDYSEEEGARVWLAKRKALLDF